MPDLPSNRLFTYSSFPFKVAWCRICNQGWVEIVKDASTNGLFVICKECENEWHHPDEAKRGNTTRKELAESILPPTFKEIRNKKWEAHIINQS